VGGGVVTVMWVCASLGCKACMGSISYNPSSCPVRVSISLSILHRWCAFSYGLVCFLSSVPTAILVVSLFCFALPLPLTDLLRKRLHVDKDKT